MLEEEAKTSNDLSGFENSFGNPTDQSIMQMIELPSRPSMMDRQFFSPSAKLGYVSTNAKSGATSKLLI